MKFRFNDRKTAQAAAYLLKLNAGRMNYMQLIKLLYLADRKMLIEHGQPITGDVFVSMKNGPVLSTVLNIVKKDAATPVSVWSEYISDPSGFEVTLKVAETHTDELSRYELRLLEEMHRQFGHMDKWELVNMLHRLLPEWRDPGNSSAAISPEDILLAAGKSPEEIAQAQRNANELCFFDSLR